MALSEDLDFSAFVKPEPDGGRLDLLVQNARCAACLSKIEQAARSAPGVSAARLNLTNKKLTVTFAPSRSDAGAVVAALERAGFPAVPYDPGQAQAEHDREGRRLILAMAVAAFGAMNAMMFSVPIWAGLFGQELGPATRTVMMWLSGAVGAPCALFAGMPFFRSAWRSLRAGRANMDVPISIGVLMTLGISFSETVLGGRDAYFDAAVSLLFLLLIGRWLDHQLRAKARSAAGDLLALQAATATVIKGGELAVRPVADVKPGELLLVRSGERIPVDCEVESGASELDNSLLTGETRTVRAVRGTVCRAGALNLSGVIQVRALAASEDSALARIARLVEAGAQAKSKYVRLADKAAAIYVPVVHTAAAATFAVGWMVGLGPREALIRAVAVLIVTCPCALGLAVPAVQVTASARLFRKGLLVKSGAALERLAEVDHVILDKTGVITEGRPRLIDADPTRLAQAAPLARATRHPLARTLADAAGAGPAAEAVRERAGQGVEGWIGEIVSGDVAGPVAEAAAATGVETWRAGATPQDKAAVVEAHAAAGRKVLMIGDGLNDAAALAKAHAAMAPGTALEASQNAADLVFSGEGLFAVVEAIDMARSARRRALENFRFATLYNLVAAPAAMLGLVNPFVAALAMSGSSLAVTLNALRTGVQR
jgi:Cu2+-exporting ATPase